MRQSNASRRYLKLLWVGITSEMRMLRNPTEAGDRDRLANTEALLRGELCLSLFAPSYSFTLLLSSLETIS